MTKKEKLNKLEQIQSALKVFPKIVKQDVERGKSHRKLMKAFAPMVKDLAKRLKNRKIGA